VDLPGVDPRPSRDRKGDSVLIAGEKAARRARGESSFHLVERGYGRFARVVRLARLRHVEARATLATASCACRMPKIADRAAARSRSVRHRAISGLHRATACSHS
jgi:HSP20 family protein